MRNVRGTFPTRPPRCFKPSSEDVARWSHEHFLSPLGYHSARSSDHKRRIFRRCGECVRARDAKWMRVLEQDGGRALSRDYRNNEQSNSGSGAHNGSGNSSNGTYAGLVQLIHTRFLIGGSSTLMTLEGRYVRARVPDSRSGSIYIIFRFSSCISVACSSSSSFPPYNATRFSM